MGKVYPENKKHSSTRHPSAGGRRRSVRLTVRLLSLMLLLGTVMGLASCAQVSFGEATDKRVIRLPFGLSLILPETAADTLKETITETSAEPSEETTTETSAETSEDTITETSAETSKDTITETSAQTAAESGTEPDTQPENYPFANAVVYTGDAHAGVDIRYNGWGINREKILVIDAGHQEKGNSDKVPVGPGSDTLTGKVSYGTTGSYTGLRESELTLRVALALRDELLSLGYSVVMIRETNEVDIGNVERALIANEVGAAAFIRIHANGWSDEDMQGAMAVCQTAQNPFPDCAAHYAESRRLCEEILDAFCAGTGISRRGFWETDTKAGTNWSAVPTVILEMGFMTNEHDDRLMASDAFPQTAAKAIAKGIVAYFKQ